MVVVVERMMSPTLFGSEAGGNLLAGLLARAQTAGANVHPGWFVFHHKGCRMNVGHPPPLGMPHGMADPVTGGGGFSTNIALQFRYFLHKMDLCPMAIYNTTTG